MKRKVSKKKVRSAKPKEFLDVFGLPDTLAGAWGFHLTGTTPLKVPATAETPTRPPYPQRPPPMYLRPIAFVGKMILDGYGAVSAVASVNHNGYVTEFEGTRFVGTYRVNTDGTGSITYPSNGYVLNFVLTNGGREMFLVSVKPTWGAPAPRTETIEPYPGTCISGIAKQF